MTLNLIFSRTRFHWFSQTTGMGCYTLQSTRNPAEFHWSSLLDPPKVSAPHLPMIPHLRNLQNSSRTPQSPVCPRWRRLGFWVGEGSPGVRGGYRRTRWRCSHSWALLLARFWWTLALSFLLWFLSNRDLYCMLVYIPNQTKLITNITLPYN